MKGLRLVWLLLSSLLLASQPATAQDCLPDFYLVGAAKASSPIGCYRLTNQGVLHSAGGIWSPNQLRLDQDFDFSFTITQCGQADGLVFVLQQAEPNNLLSGDGNTMGYYQESGTGTPAIGIELDLFTNAHSPYNDPPYAHVALAINHTPAPVLGPVRVADLGNCQPRIFRVSWDHTAQQLRVLLAGQLMFTYSQDIVARIFGGNPIVNFGWVGSTGDYTATQDVCPAALTGTLAPLLASGPPPLCAGGGEQAVLSVAHQPVGATYQWWPAAGLDAPTKPQVVARPTVTTTYYVLVTSPTGCQRRDSVRVEVLPRPAVQVSTHQILCPGDNVLLQARSPDAGLTHSWASTPSLAPMMGDSVRVQPTTTTRYTVTTTGPGYCTRQDTVSIGVRPALQLRVSAQLATQPGSPTQLTALSPVAGLTYQWTPASGLNTQLGAQVEATPVAPTTYTVTAADAGGCQAQASVEVLPYYILLLPNIITPNGDQLNDTFQVRALPEQITLQVYSRWGRLVFEQADYHNSWGAEGLAAGTYYYYLHLVGGRHWQGWVEVVH